MPAMTIQNFDATCDAIDDGEHIRFMSAAQQFCDILYTVNVMKGKMWNSESEFDKNTDKGQFRDYEFACDRVKAFYREQHGN